jgi:hypothetical protein
MEGLLGLSIEVELIARLQQLLKSRGADACVQRDATSVASFLFRVKIVKPDDKTFVFFQLALISS